jgi:hypothetical protein
MSWLLPEDGCLLGCSAEYSGRSLPTFQMSLLPPSSGLIALMTEAARTSSETLENFYHTTRRYNPEDTYLRTLRRENLKSYFFPLRRSDTNRGTWYQGHTTVTWRCTSDQQHLPAGLVIPWFAIALTSKFQCRRWIATPFVNSVLRQWMCTYSINGRHASHVWSCMWQQQGGQAPLPAELSVAVTSTLANICQHWLSPTRNRNISACYCKLAEIIICPST